MNSTYGFFGVFVFGLILVFACDRLFRDLKEQGEKKEYSGRDQSDESLPENGQTASSGQKQTGFDERLIQPLRETVLIYFYVNLTKDRIIGSIIQDFDDGTHVDVLKALGLSDNCNMSDFVAAWRSSVDEKFLSAYDDFFNIGNLLENYREGIHETSLIYKTFNARGEDLWAKQTLLLSEEEGTGDIIAFVYAHDVTAEMQRRE